MISLLKYCISFLLDYDHHQAKNSFQKAVDKFNRSHVVLKWSYISIVPSHFTNSVLSLEVAKRRDYSPANILAVVPVLQCSQLKICLLFPKTETQSMQISQTTACSKSKSLWWLQSWGAVGFVCVHTILGFLEFLWVAHVPHCHAHNCYLFKEQENRLNNILIRKHWQHLYKRWVPWCLRRWSDHCHKRLYDCQR